MQSFVVQSEEIEGRLDVEYYKPEFATIKTDLAKCLHPIKQIKDCSKVICGPFGSSIQVKDYQKIGIPLIRIANIDDNQQFIKENITFVNESLAKQLQAYKVKEGDLVISQRGTLGLTAIISHFFDGAIISANFIAVKDLQGILPEYLKIYLNSRYGQIQLKQKISGQVQIKITTDDIKTIYVPLPPLSIQNKIVEIMQSAYSRKKQMEAEAQRLLDSIDSYVLDELGIKLPEVEGKMCFVVSSEEVQNNRADVEYYQPFFEHVVSKVAGSKYNLSKLKDVTLLISNGRTPAKEMYDVDNEEDGSVPIIKAASASARLVDLEKLGYAKADFNGGKKTQKGDIFILSAAHQAKYVGKNVSILAVEPPQDTYFVGELICVRANPEIAMPEYLFGFLSGEIGYILLNREKRGQTSHIYPEDIKDIFVPLPPLEIQNKIADEVKRRISDAERLKAEASRIIEEAKKKAEEMILGGQLLQA